ncbi:uncharacterized protein A1O9_13107 [Exophiala aquamarina CBS 119918]|uniref:Uncharacterized protein n=1 Tax=Exophiala aquamarina CBS 119918 TaxID=1182545 RepID=A0A072NUY9_9EURO|nr:uncharacterized protein A1O9_13107 [Exophiala aquamarina CBS 119918]KEF50843.1 hypothetical protein A1O9_13107 [Exophiala aquamarina CBS 119918]
MANYTRPGLLIEIPADLALDVHISQRTRQVTADEIYGICGSAYPQCGRQGSESRIYSVSTISIEFNHRKSEPLEHVSNSDVAEQLDALGFRHNTIKLYGEWLKKHFGAEISVDEIQKACDAVLENHYDLAQLYEDRNLDFFSESGVELEVARVFTDFMWSAFVIYTAQRDAIARSYSLLVSLGYNIVPKLARTLHPDFLVR